MGVVNNVCLHWNNVTISSGFLRVLHDQVTGERVTPTLTRIMTVETHIGSSKVSLRHKGQRTDSVENREH